MIWQKEFGYDYNKNIDFLIATIIVLTIVGLIFRRPILFIVIGLFAAYLLINYIYDRRVGNRLAVSNPRTTIRLFPGEEDTLTFDFENRSIFPYVNGTFKFQLDRAVQASDYVDFEEKSWAQHELPLSVIGRGKTYIHLPIEAKHRGTSRVRNINYTIPHLFNFDTIHLTYTPFYHIEFIVYPKLLPVQGVKDVFQVTPGDQLTNFSPYEDIQSPLGTRDYSFNDPFHRINWKASAKTQQLQTNIYEKNIDKSYLFIVNLGTKHGLNQASLNKNMENLLSYTAYLSNYATEHSLPYEVAINARRLGGVPYVYLPRSEGRTHYVETLEMLARIHPQSVVVPFIEMLHRMRQHALQANTIVVIGEVPEEAHHLLEQWQRHQKQILHVKSYGDEAGIERWKKEVIQDAK